MAPDTEAKSIAALTLLLDAGADIDKKTLAAGAGSRSAGRTALFGAAFWGWSDVVDFLVARGAKIDVADPTGLTPVDAALGRAWPRGATIEVFDDTAARLQSCVGRLGCDLSQPSALRRSRGIPC
jgi:hypothetical protein